MNDSANTDGAADAATAAPRTQTGAGPTTITGMDLAGYTVSDGKRALAFYRDVLGLTPTSVDAEGRGAEFTFADGSTFGVWNPNPAGQGSPGAIVMFAVADARATVAQLRDRGLEIGDAYETGVCVMAQASDPDGNAFIIHQRTVVD
jgi:predicted enzyme related to lactoylglutathione lyase